MPEVHAQVVEGTGKFHDPIGKADFGMAKQVVDEVTAFDAGYGVFHDNPRRGQEAIQDEWASVNA